MERSFSNAANLSVQQSTPSIFHGGPYSTAVFFCISLGG